MFVFTFDRKLFRFNADGPEFEALLKLAPPIGKRYSTYSRREPRSLNSRWFLSAILSSRPEAFLFRKVFPKQAHNAFHQ